MTAVLPEQLAAPPIEPSARPALRLVPAPVSAPPYDDEPGARPVLRLVPPLPPVPGPQRFDPEVWLASSRTPSAELPDVTAMCRVLITALLEVRAGVRPIQQLRRDTTPEVFMALRSSLSIRPRVSGARADRGMVRSLHVQQRPDGVAEVCATVRQGSRYAALALRLEGVDGRWRCTDLVGA